MTIDSLATDLLKAFTEIRKLHHLNEIKDFGPAELHVGHILLENETLHSQPLIAKDIAIKTKMSKPVVSRVMKNLEMKGMINRVVPDDNHRIVYYTLSEKGKNFLIKGAEEMYIQVKEIIKIMGEENAQSLINNINQLNLAIQNYKERKG